MKKITLILVSILIFGTVVLAQEEGKSKKEKKDYSFTKQPSKKIALDLYGGFPFPTGDVKVDFKDKFPLYNAGAGLSYNLTSVFSLRADYNYTRLHGQNDRRINNEFFENRIHKWSVGMEAHLFNLFRFSQISKRFQPFIGVGVGQAKSNVVGGLDGVELPEHTYESFNLLYQASAGFRVNITKWMDAFFRYDMHFAKTDSLDGFDWDLNANKYYDSYINANVGLTFKIGKKGVDHYVWVRDEFNAKNFESDFDKLRNQMDSIAEETDSIKKNLEQVAAEAKSCCDENRSTNESLQRQIDELNQKIDGGMFSAETEDDVYLANIPGATPGSYHVIVGSYNVKNNALKEQQRLEALGHKIEILFEPSLELHRLSIISSMDFNSIKASLEQYRSSVDVKSWVLRVK